MNPLQSGTPASQLTPQAFKNSAQSGNFQSGISGSDLFESGSASYTLQVNPQIKLSVTSNNSQQVLSASTTSTAQNTSVRESTNNFVPVAFVVLFVSLVLAVYFFRKYKISTVLIEDTEDTTPEE